MLILIHLAGWGFRVAWLCGSIFFWPKLHTVILLFCLLHRVPPLGFSSWAQRNHSTQRLLTERDMLGINGGGCCAVTVSFSLVPLFVTPWTTYSRPGSSVHGESPGRNNGVRCYALLQGIFQSQGSNRSPSLLADSLLSEPPGKP